MDHALLRLDARLELLSSHIDNDRVLIHAVLRHSSACCPKCHCLSSYRHSRYTRTWSDLPDGGIPVTVHLELAKWFCKNPACAQVVFVERLPWLSPYQRRSRRLEDQVRAIAFSTSALQAEKLCRALGIVISHDAVLTVIDRTELPESTSPFRRYR